MGDNSSQTRRALLATIGAGTVGSVAGCLGGEGNGGDSGGTAESMSFADFEPADPEFPQPANVLYDQGFESGTPEDLENVEPRDSARYGIDPLELPSDESEWLDPDTITFSMGPDEESAVVEERMEPFLTKVEAETGRNVEFTPNQSQAAEVEAMRSERLHLCAFSTGTVPFAVNMAGAVPYGMQLSPDGSYGYRLWLITHMDNTDVNSLDDLQGETVAHTGQTSNSGHQAQSALFSQAGLEPNEDYTVEFSGGHDQSNIGVYNGDYLAAATCSSCPQRYEDEGLIDTDDIKVVFSSGVFPVRAFSHHYKLHPDIVEGIERATFDEEYWTDERIEQANGRIEPIDYASHWDEILAIQEYNDVEYDEM